MFDNEYKTAPEVKHWHLVSKYNGEERLISEPQLKKAFSHERWVSITSGTDDYFTAFEYNTDEKSSFNP